MTLFLAPLMAGKRHINFMTYICIYLTEAAVLQGSVPATRPAPHRIQALVAVSWTAATASRLGVHASPHDAARVTGVTCASVFSAATGTKAPCSHA